MTPKEIAAIKSLVEKMIAETMAERNKKTQEIARLKNELLAYDSEILGDAVKFYISENGDASKLADNAYMAFETISKIMILELEC